MWTGSGPREEQKNGWAGSTASWRTWHRQNSSGHGSESRIRKQSTLLSDCGERNLFCRSEKDRGVDGELSEGYWYAKLGLLLLFHHTMHI